jgi:hypothetical protein
LIVDRDNDSANERLSIFSALSVMLVCFYLQYIPVVGLTAADVAYPKTAGYVSGSLEMTTNSRANTVLTPNTSL